MADKDKPGGDTPKTPRRRRTTTPAKAAAKSRSSRKAKPKGEDAAKDAAAAKPKAKPAPKPRSSKRTTTKTGAKRARTAASTAPAPAADPIAGTGLLRGSLDRLGRRARSPWSAAAIAGGLAAAAALLSLRGSTAKREKDGDQPGDEDGEADRPDAEQPDKG